MKTLKFLGLIAGLSWVLVSCNGPASQLRDHGQETEATIRGKNTLPAIKASSRKYFLRVAFFAQDSAAIAKGAHAADDVLKDTTLSMADRIEKWQPGGGGMGEYMTVEIEVDHGLFEKYFEGDKVKIVYLPEDPKVAMLKEQL